VLNANLATFVLLAPDLEPLSIAQTNFATAYTAQVSAEAAIRHAVETKKLKRAAVETVTRAMIRRINGHPNMTDASALSSESLCPTACFRPPESPPRFR